MSVQLTAMHPICRDSTTNLSLLSDWSTNAESGPITGAMDAGASQPALSLVDESSGEFSVTEDPMKPAESQNEAKPEEKGAGDAKKKDGAVVAEETKEESNQ